MSTKRCPGCLVNWPDAKDYTKCPVCEVETEYIFNESAILHREAKEQATAARWKRFYQMWDRARERRGDLSPEAKGALEAKEIAKLSRQTGVWGKNE